MSEVAEMYAHVYSRLQEKIGQREWEWWEVAKLLNLELLMMTEMIEQGVVAGRQEVGGTTVYLGLEQLMRAGVAAEMRRQASTETTVVSWSGINEELDELMYGKNSERYFELRIVQELVSTLDQEYGVMPQITDE